MKKVFLLFFIVIIAISCGKKNYSEYDKPHLDGKWTFGEYLEKYPNGYYSCRTLYLLAEFGKNQTIDTWDKVIADCRVKKSLPPDYSWFSSEQSREQKQINHDARCREAVKKAWNKIGQLVSKKYLKTKLVGGTPAAKYPAGKRDRPRIFVLDTNIEKIPMINDYQTLSGKVVVFGPGPLFKKKLPVKICAKTYAEANILVFIIDQHNKVGFGANNITVSFERIDSTVIFINLKTNRILGKKLFAGEDPPSRGKFFTYGGIATGSISGKKCPYLYDFIVSMFEKKGQTHTIEPWEKAAWKGWAYSIRSTLTSARTLIPISRHENDTVIVPALHGGYTEVSRNTIEMVIESQRPGKFR